jgi:hypothetical protein
MDSGIIYWLNFSIMNKFGLVLILLSYCANANAYIDPGTSLLMIQGVLAFAGGVLMFCKNPLKTTKTFLSRFKTKKEKEKHDA